MVMSETLRPRRSVLYMPAANERALEKAQAISADAIIFDLEDAVAPEAKPDARSKAVAAVQSGNYGNRELTIRCNGLDTQWGTDDVTAAAGARPSAVVIPKVDSVAGVEAVAALLDAAGASDVMIWPMIETPTAMFNVREIAAHPRVAVLVMGTNDLAKELRSPLVPGRHPLVVHLATALLAAREAGATFTRVCGAGGGGVMGILCPLDKVSKISAAMREAGGQIMDVTVGGPGVSVHVLT